MNFSRHIRVTHSGKNRIIVALIALVAIVTMFGHAHANGDTNSGRYSTYWDSCYTHGVLAKCIDTYLTGRYITRREFNTWRIAFADDVRTLNGDNNSQWGTIKAIFCRTTIDHREKKVYLWRWDFNPYRVSICLAGNVNRATSSLATTG